MLKTLFIIPGIGESIRSNSYTRIAKQAKKLGIKVVPVSIHWYENMVTSDYLKEALAKIKKRYSKDECNAILGFSVGALIAVQVARKIKFNHVFLCSLSPYFKNDIWELPNEAKEYLGNSFMSDLRKYTFPKELNSHVSFFFGKDDWPIAIAKARQKFRSLHAEKKDFNLIKRTKHELSAKYIDQIVAKLKSAFGAKPPLKSR